MDKRDRQQYIRLIYGRTFSYLGIMCVIALLVGALLGGGVFMVNAMCAFGFVMLCWGWFTYLIATGLRLPGLEFWRKTKKKIQGI